MWVYFTYFYIFTNKYGKFSKLTKNDNNIWKMVKNRVDGKDDDATLEKVDFFCLTVILLKFAIFIWTGGTGT